MRILFILYLTIVFGTICRQVPQAFAQTVKNNGDGTFTEIIEKVSDTDEELSHCKKLQTELENQQNLVKTCITKVGTVQKSEVGKSVPIDPTATVSEAVLEDKAAEEVTP